MPENEDDPISQMHRAYADLVRSVSEEDEWSLSTRLSADVRKLLVLACASRFEKQIQDIILAFVHSASSSDERLVHLVRSKVIERQYHTYFDWDRSNANKFFAMFGPDLKERAKICVENDGDLKRAIGAFLEIGRTRNELIHVDFVTFPLDKTADEVFALFQQAKAFIAFLEEQLGGATGEQTSEMVGPQSG